MVILITLARRQPHAMAEQPRAMAEKKWEPMDFPPARIELLRTGEQESRSNVIGGFAASVPSQWPHSVKQMKWEINLVQSMLPVVVNFGFATWGSEHGVRDMGFGTFGENSPSFPSSIGYSPTADREPSKGVHLPKESSSI